MARILATTWLAAAFACASAQSIPSRCEQGEGALVELRGLDESFLVELRYRTPDNFTGAPLPGYDADAALLRPDAAEALARVQARLREQGLGLKVWDGYRPRRATLAMVEWAERTGNQWVVEQGYVARESGHNKGNTVDLTLVRLISGQEMEMGTPFDHFGRAAHTAEGAGEAADNRAILLEAMEAEGWENFPQEWWHFSYPGEHRPLDLALSCFRDTTRP